MGKTAKTLEARVKDDHSVRSVTAFGGREYVKGEWRVVAAGQEVSAEAHPFLELREAGGGAVSQDPPPVAGVVDAPPASSTAKGAPPAPVVDEVDKASPEELDETQGTPPEDGPRAPVKGKGKGGARRGKP